MAKVEIKNIVLGGIADSDFLGGPQSVAESVNLDLFSEPGIVKVNQKLTKESGSVVDDLIKARVSCSDGKQYFFGSTNGKVWSRTTAGVWTLEATVSPAAGAAGVLGAHEYQGYIYYATQSRLGRVAVGSAWSTRNDNWATFTNTDASWHPMKIVNLVLYIGDANYVAQVDAGTFSANALNVGSPLRIKCLGRSATNLLIGTFYASTIVETQVFNWNTWSVSYTSSDPIPEVGINAFLDTDNLVIVSAGVKGNLYSYDGTSLDLYKNVKGVYNNSSKQATVHPNAVLNFHGLPLFGFSNVSGDPALEGVYSLGRSNRNYPYILNLEHTISTGHRSSIEIGAICAAGDVFLVSWKDTNGGTSYGVDVLDLTAKYASAYYTSRVIATDRVKLENFGPVYVPYRLLPTGTSIKVYAKKNNGSLTEITETKDDTDRSMLFTDIDVGEAGKLQVRTELVGSGNDAPEVEETVVALNDGK